MNREDAYRKLKDAIFFLAFSCNLAGADEEYMKRVEQIAQGLSAVIDYLEDGEKDV